MWKSVYARVKGKLFSNSQSVPCIH